MRITGNFFNKLYKGNQINFGLSDFIIIKAFSSFLFILLLFSGAFGQAQHTENKADQVLRGSGRVNPSTLGMEIDIPLGSYPGRGINVPISLSYSSKLWRMDYTGSWPGGVVTGGCKSVNSAKYSENSAAGWTTSLAVPYIEYVGKDNIYNHLGFPLGDDTCDPTAPPTYYQNAYIRRLSIHLPGGETHELRADDAPVIYPPSSTCPPANGYGCDPNAPNLQYNWDRTYYAVDGSNIKYVENSTTTPSTYRLLMPDGSFYDFAATTSYYNQSTARKAVKFTDRNGNFTSYNDQTGAWTDTMGRTLAPPFGTSAPTAPTTQTYTMPGMTGNYQFRWKKLKDTTAAESALTDFSQELRYYSDRYHTSTYPYWATRPAGTFLFGSTWESYVNTPGIFNPVVLTEIVLPTGQSYKFSYNVYGQIEKISYPTGGEERFVYNEIPPLAESIPGNVSDQTNFGVTNRKLYPTAGQPANYEWNYGVTYVAPSGYKVSTTSPDGTINQRILHRGYAACEGCTQGTFGYDNGLAGMPYEELNFSNTGQLVTRKLTSWTKTSLLSGGSVPADWHPRVNYEEAIIYDASGNGVSATTKYEYEGNLSLRETPLLVNKTTQYAFVAIGSGGSSAANTLPDPDDTPDPHPTPIPIPTPASLTPVKITETTYVINDAVTYPDWVRDIYKAQNMVGLVRTSTVKNGAGTVVHRSEMRYDDGVLSPAIGRGNPTISRTWDSTKGAWGNPTAYIQTSAKFDNWGNQIEATDAKGNTTVTTFDSTYHAFSIQVTSAIPDPSSAQNPDGLPHASNMAFVSTATFDPVTGLPLTTTDANGLEARIEYDPVTLRPLNTKTFYQGNQIGSMSETIYHDEPNNYWIKQRTQIDIDKWAENVTYFDGLGRSYKSEEVSLQGNIFINKEFDADGRVLRVSNPYKLINDPCYQNNQILCWTTNVYDESSRVKEVILPDGAKVKTDYGVSVSGIIGITKQITDQAGKKRLGISDALGRMIRVIEDPNGQNLVTDYVFDTLGNLRKTIQGEQSRYFTHDSLGRLLYAKQPEQEANATFVYTDIITNNSQWSVKYEYDDNGNITKTTNANGVYVQGTYDKFNRLIYRDYSDATPDISFFYDGNYLNGNDVLQTATGSVRGKTTGIKSSVSRTNYTSFDNLGRLLTHQQITDGQTYSTGYNYNLSGALIAETYPSGRIVNYELNGDGNLSRIAGQTANGAKTYANGFNYNSFGALEKMRLGNGKWETTKYNNRQQVTEIGLGNGSTDSSLLKLSFGYGTNLQNNGSLQNQTIQVPSVGANSGFTATQIYTYDDLNRLQSATENVAGQTNPTWKQTFTYDRYGNRRFDALNTTTLSISVPSKVLNPQINTSDNRLKKDQDGDTFTDYDFDKEGNLTLDSENRRFIYDAENRLKEFFGAGNNTSTPDAIYFYDGEARRVKKISATETTVFVYDGTGQPIAEYSTQTVQNPTTNYLTQDNLGSPRIITDTVGAVVARKDFSAFGDETFTPQRTANLGYKPENIRQDYTGYQKDDETNLEYAQARYYNSSHGRFTSVDPLTASATIKNPQTFNRYSYVLNSPYKFSDPLGLLPQGASSQTGCGAEYSSCSDYDWSDVWDSIPETHSNEADAAPAVNNTAAEGSSAQGEPVAAPPPPPPPAPDQNADLTDAEIRARYPVFNATDQTTVNQAISDATDIVDPRGATNIVPSILTGNFRGAGDTSTPRQAMAAVDATTGVNITRNDAGEVTNLTMQNVFDGRTSTLPIDHDNNPQTPEITVAEYFRTNTDVNAITLIGTGQIFLGAGFFSQNAGGRAKTMIHEGVVHKGFGRRDTEFGATQPIGSRAINAKIDAAMRYYRQPPPAQVIQADSTPISTQITPRVP